MNIFIKFKNYIIYTFEQGSLGLSLIELFIILVSFVFALVIRGFFAKLIVSKIKKIVKKTGNKIDDHLFDTLSPPLKLLPIVFVFLMIALFVNSENQLGLLLEKINQTLVTIFIFWLIHQALVLWLTRSLKYLIIFLGAVAVLETWGIKIGPVIAGLGLFGVAVALGAQDLFKNLISGIMIILEKRFELNDIIEVPGQAMGVVEHIGFRSTLIRKFDSTPISIPNYVFSDTSIVNFSDRKYRRIKWIIGLTYNTSTNQLKEICQMIDSFISSNDNFIVNDIYKIYVRVEKFNDSSIDVLIQTFTNTNDWDKYLKIKEELALMIKDIVEKNNSSFAFPSQSIYMEK